jgi:acetyltransferase-like isoleucine patch superfamily enzyme
MMDNIDDQFVHLGKDVFVGNNVTFDKIQKVSKQGTFQFGDYCSIHDNCRFFMSNAEFNIGDYGTIHNNTFVTGYKSCNIGHNFWVGQNSILNATDNLKIGNNCGIGAYSKIWTHAAFGELLLGTRIALGLHDFQSKSGAVKIGDDFWGIGSITISPGVTIGNKVIALTNSLITTDIPDNTIVAGTPAKPIAIDGDFRAYIDLNENEKYSLMKEFAQNFSKTRQVKIICDDGLKKITLGDDEIVIKCKSELEEHPKISYFDFIKRTYTKKHNFLEREFMKFVLDYKARFVPE